MMGTSTRIPFLSFLAYGHQKTSLSLETKLCRTVSVTTVSVPTIRYLNSETSRAWYIVNKSLMNDYRILHGSTTITTTTFSLTLWLRLTSTVRPLPPVGRHDVLSRGVSSSPSLSRWGWPTLPSEVYPVSPSDRRTRDPTFVSGTKHASVGGHIWPT